MDQPDSSAMAQPPHIGIDPHTDGSLSIQSTNGEGRPTRTILSLREVLSLYAFFQRPYIKRWVEAQMEQNAAPIDGLYSSEYLRDLLTEELELARLQHRPVGVIVFSIDYFEHLSDRYGYGTIDTLLRAIHNYLRSIVRSGDVFGWSEKEQFTVILPGSPLDNTLRRAAQVSQGIAEVRVQGKYQTIEHMTISAGVVSFPDHGTSSEDLLNQAEHAMRVAQAEGHNRVLVAPVATAL